MAINSCNLSGNLVRDVEVRATNSGTEIYAFTVAVNNRRKNQQTGEWEDDPAFVDVTMFGKRAAYACGGLGKGQPVAVSGRLVQDNWTDQQGNNRSRLKVIADEVVPGARRNEALLSPAGTYDEDVPW